MQTEYKRSQYINVRVSVILSPWLMAYNFQTIYSALCTSSSLAYQLDQLNDLAREVELKESEVFDEQMRHQREVSNERQRHEAEVAKETKKNEMHELQLKADLLALQAQFSTLERSLFHQRLELAEVSPSNSHPPQRLIVSQ
jgi:hypothetical protein